MKKAVLKRLRPFIDRVVAYCGLVALLFTVSRILADQVEMQNGDRYLGRVISLTNDTLIVQSDYLGTLRLPRSKVALVTLGQSAATATPRPAAALPHQPASPSSSASNSAPALPEATQIPGANSNLIQQVHNQFLSGAGPEANAKFDELLSGYMSGKLSVSDIRSQAR